VTLVGSANFAAYAEAELRGKGVSDAAIAAEIAPCFVDADGRRTDTIVLACTHYPLLLGRLEKVAPWPVRFIDPAPAIARRLLDLIGPAPGPQGTAQGKILFTSGQRPGAALTEALARFGLAP
jgi:glutamate racemase